ncbi:MAG: cytochrome c family protein [Hyphomicrobiaceae bacterium]
MDSFEINKIAGAVLSALLLVFGSSVLIDMWHGSHQSKLTGFTLPAPAAGGATAGAPAAESAFTVPKIAELMTKASVEGGAAAFKKCATCHTPDKGGKNGTGPNLYGVVGRKVGATDGFAYSGAMKGKGGEWTWDSLIAYLNAPAAAIPGNKMAFAGVKDAGELADILVYMRSLSDSPAALPK